MICSKQDSLVKELSVDWFPTVKDFKVSRFDGICCLSFVFSSISSVIVSGYIYLIHSLIFILFSRSKVLVSSVSYEAIAIISYSYVILLEYSWNWSTGWQLIFVLL